MKKAYIKAVIVGLSTLVLLVLLFNYCSYRAGLEMEEYNKEPRPYDNDFIGIEWMFVLILGTLIAVILAGAFAVLWAMNDIGGPFEAIEVSALTFAMPGIIILAFIVLLGILEATYGPSRQFSVEMLLASFRSGVLLLGMVYFAFCIFGSAVSGLFCYLLFSKWRSGVRVIDLMSLTRAGVIGAVIVFTIYAIGFFRYGDVRTFVIPFYELFLFVVVSALAGIFATVLSRESRLTKSAVVTSLATGLIVGLGGIMGRFLFFTNISYNSPGTLLIEGPGFFADGMVFALLGTVLFFALTSRNGRDGQAPSRLLYINALAVGMCSGLVWLAIQIVIPSIRWPILLIIYLVSVIAAGALSARLSEATAPGDAAAVSGVAGGVGCIIVTIGDLLYMSLSRTDIPFVTASLSQEVRFMNMLSALGWASVKVALIMSLACWAGIMYVLLFKKADEHRTNS